MSVMSTRKAIFAMGSVALMLVLLAAGMFGQSGGDGSLYRPLSIFTEVYSLVRNGYVEEPPADRLIEGAFTGVTDAIDEFSYYVPPSQMAEYKGYAERPMTPLGLVVSKRFGYAYVIAAIEGSPAALAGVEKGDFIEKIDGRPTQDMAVWQIHDAFGGNSEKPLGLVVLRSGMGRREILAIRRGMAGDRDLKLETRNAIAILTIPVFETGTAARFAARLDEVRKAGTARLIVDVRGNAGGDVEEAVMAADALLSKGLITAVAGRRAEKQSWQADRATQYDGELQVLIDNSTAGAGEIFAAAIRGNDRGKLVGVSTYGKSVVQKFVILPSGGGLFMTIGHYTTPELKPILEQGVRPDVLVDLAVFAIRDAKGKKSDAPRKDLILNKALSIYRQPVAQRPAA